MIDPRRRIDERALDKEGEDYFNKDGDEEDTASVSTSLAQKGQQKPPILSNGVAASYSQLSPKSGGLVDYDDDDDDDDDYKPPPRMRPEFSENEETMESIRLKRKLPSMDKEPELVKKQKLSKNSKSKDGIFVALCSTLIQAMLRGKKTEITTHIGPRTTEISEENQEKSPNISSNCSDNSSASADENLEKGTATARSFSNHLHETSNNRQLDGDGCPLVPPKSSLEMTVNGS